jgi:hypothetical protein
MLKLKTQFIYIFAVLIAGIASCITFNNSKNIDNYDYTHQLLVQEINFFGPLTVYEASGLPNKKKSLLLLLKNNQLQYLSSNDYSHWYRYRYTKLAENTHLLVSQKNKEPLFSRYDDRTRDSIFFSPEICIRKRGNFSDARTSVVPRSLFSVYILDKDSLHQYFFDTRGNENTFQYTQSLQIISFASYLLQQYKNSNNPLQFVKTFFADEFYKETFFRKEFMHR